MHICMYIYIYIYIYIMCVYIYIMSVYIYNVCMCVCMCGYALDIFNIFLRDYLWFNICITTIGDNKILTYKILYVLNQARRSRGGWQPPRFWLKLTLYQLTIIVKRKKELKNINHVKFLENYW